MFCGLVQGVKKLLPGAPLPLVLEETDFQLAITSQKWDNFEKWWLVETEKINKINVPNLRCHQLRRY